MVTDKALLARKCSSVKAAVRVKTACSSEDIGEVQIKRGKSRSQTSRFRRMTKSPRSNSECSGATRMTNDRQPYLVTDMIVILQVDRNLDNAEAIGVNIDRPC
jgi:hypothetical protein